MEKELANSIVQTVTTEAAKGFWQRVFVLYHGLISRVPEPYQWIVSLIILLALASLLFNLIKKNWLWVILVVVLFPGLLPIIKNFFDSLALILIGKQI